MPAPDNKTRAVINGNERMDGWIKWMTLQAFVLVGGDPPILFPSFVRRGRGGRTFRLLLTATSVYAAAHRLLETLPHHASPYKGEAWEKDRFTI
jgi:hypothetical protein